MTRKVVQVESTDETNWPSRGTGKRAHSRRAHHPRGCNSSLKSSNWKRNTGATGRKQAGPDQEFASVTVATSFHQRS